MENLFSVASEAYQSDSAVKGLEKYIAHARDQYRKGQQQEAFNTLKEMAKDIKEIFNFKGVSVNLNNSTLGPYGGTDDYCSSGATSSICRITMTYGTQRQLDNKEIEILKNTYRFKQPTAYCNLSIYAPRILADDLYTVKEIVALIIQQVGYSFYAWTNGRQIQLKILQALRVLMTLAKYNDPNATTSDKVADTIDTAAYIAPAYIKEWEHSSRGPSNSKFIAFIDKLGSMIGAGALIALGPVIAVLSIFVLPIMGVLEIINKIFGFSYDEVDKFIDQFTASYGYGEELMSALNKTKRQNKDGRLSKSFNNFLDLYSEIFMSAAIMYTWTSDTVGCVNSTAVLTRIESMIVYYEQELDNCRGNKEVSAELRDKIKSLKLMYENLKSKPRENFTPSAIVAKLWSKLFGTDTVAINRLDKEIEEVKKGKQSRFK